MKKMIANLLNNISSIWLFLLCSMAYCLWTGCSQPEPEAKESNLLATNIRLKGTAKATLSEYGFFKDLKNQIPADNVIKYDLNSPLFSDYAHKARFVKLPDGMSAEYHPKYVFDFPKGTTIIKTFYYPNDFRNEAMGHFNIETRLLIHEEGGWAAYSYVWNDEQTDAIYEVAGGRKDITWTHYDGSKKELNYVIPNVNQCKGCHAYNGKMIPIGPTARQLNGDFAYYDGTKENQLLHWQKNGILSNLPDLAEIKLQNLTIFMLH
jgi:uncharacterized repeat protein (TIGR03806 family)